MVRRFLVRPAGTLGSGGIEVTAPLPVDHGPAAWQYLPVTMSSTGDLRELLESWPYDPDHDVRLMKGADGRSLLQVRLPLGIEQYELEGRPDGRRPAGKESLLDHHLEQWSKACESGDASSFQLSKEDCAELFSEGLLYYNRYFQLFRLRDWRRTMRDTERNLRLFDFVRKHASEEEDQNYLERWRPYIVRVHGFARAMLEVESDRPSEALEIILATLRQIEGMEELDDETFQFERRRSLMILKELYEQVGQNLPASETERLEQDLRVAIEAQEFERAAELRDRIRALRRGSVQEGGSG